MRQHLRSIKLRLDHARLGLGVLVVMAVLGIGAASVVVAPASIAGAATDIVTSCSGSGPGSLPAVIGSASAGDVITFSVSCPPSSPIVIGATIDIAVDLTIDGPGPGTLAVSGGNDFEVFDIASGTNVTMSGLTIEDGDVPSNGGGVLDAGILALTDSVVSGNYAGYEGGGIYTTAGSTLDVTDTTLSGNTAVIQGGGIYNDGTATVTASTLSGNTCTGAGTDIAGGGIASTNGGVAGVVSALVVTDSTFSGNSCWGSGAAIFNFAGRADVTDSTLSDNVADYGGGVYNDGDGQMDITDSTVSGNTATLRSDGAGGGIYNLEGSTLDIADSTVSGNSSTEVGGGIFSTSTLEMSDSTVAGNDGGLQGGGLGVGGTAQVTSTTFWGNSADSGGGIHSGAPDSVSLSTTIVAGSGAGLDCVGPIADGGYDLDDDGSCGFTSPSIPDTAAGLDPSGLQYNGGSTETIALEPDSPAIGAVTDASLCSGLDQRGVPLSVPCDIGAVQLVTSAPPATVQAITSPNSDTVTAGLAFVFTVTTIGLPVPVVSWVGSKLPLHVVFHSGDGTATISGKPTVAGVYHLTFKATFGTGYTEYFVRQQFTLTVDAP